MLCCDSSTYVTKQHLEHEPRAVHSFQCLVAGVRFDGVGGHGVAEILSLTHLDVYCCCGDQELAHALQGERHHEVPHHDDGRPYLSSGISQDVPVHTNVVRVCVRGASSLPLGLASASTLNERNWLADIASHELQFKTWRGSSTSTQAVLVYSKASFLQEAVDEITALPHHCFSRTLTLAGSRM